VAGALRGDGLVSKPLDGVRVLDITRFPPGAYCTLLLGDLGADVVWLEAPGSSPMMAGIGVGLSRGKRSVVVDLRNPRSNEVLRRLAGWADVLVENNRPGELESRGFGYPQAAVEFPELIWCSITGFGQDGPYAQWAGHDLTYTAHSGLLTGINRDLPWHPQVVLAVPLGAMMAATGVVSALYERQRTGKGTHLDISLAESATWLLSGSDREINGNPWGIPVGADRRLYECSDGRYVTVAAAEPRTWAALTTGLGLADLAEGGVPRGDDVEAARTRIAEVFATRPAAEWVAELGPTGAAIGILNRGTDLPNDPHVQARGALVQVGDLHVPANPIRRRDLQGSIPQDAPLAPAAVGADTRDVLAAAGYSADEIDELVSDGVVAVG
jgi:alpha-methylacyl-CoA racemase